jgi:hypothetical protein
LGKSGENRLPVLCRQGNFPVRRGNKYFFLSSNQPSCRLPLAEGQFRPFPSPQTTATAICRSSEAEALSLAELLAIILLTGTRGDNALELANKLLAKYGGLPGLARADFRELCAEHGMGEAKSAQVKAALELGRRLALVQMDERYKISTPRMRPTW